MRRKIQVSSSATDGANRFSEGILVAVIAALVAVIGAGLTFYSSWLSNHQATTQSCISRLDQQEARIRDKATVFLGDLSDLFGRGADPTIHPKELIALSVKTMRSALEFAAHAPPDMGISAVKVASAIRDSLTVSSENEAVIAVEKLNDIASSWPQQYYQLMEDFQSSKIDCQR